MGIAAGIRSKCKIGDVFIPCRIVDDGTKVAEDGAFKGRPEIFRPPHIISQMLSSFRRDDELWKQYFKEIFPQPVIPELGKEIDYRDNVAEYPTLYDSALASANILIRDPEHLPKLQNSTHQQIRIGDMEAGGFVKAAIKQTPAVPWMIVRAVSDFGDSFKNDDFHRQASCAVASYVKMFLSNGYNKNFFTEQKLSRNSSLFTTRGENKDVIDRYLTQRLDKALLSFSSQPKVWVDPILCKTPEISKRACLKDKVALSELILNPKSTLIKAPPQFGLTCLSLYLIREAWRSQASIWIYLDSKSLKPYSSAIEQAVKDELNIFGCDTHNVKCVILDSWISHEKYSYKILKNVCKLFKDVPVMVMQAIDDSRLLNHLEEDLPERKFDVLYLWTLSRGHVREVVTCYNDKKHIGDDNAVITRVVSDLEALNLHRTPLNCLTLLKVFEVDFEESPVNRTEMIKRVLFLLFNLEDLPTYKVRPDLKDCEYVLGYFCEQIIKENNYYFTREHFLFVLQSFCKERFMDIEVEVVFDVLYENGILVKRGNLFCFKFSYWIYYFAAQRMHQDKDFASFMYEDMRYARYPEIIEFYTGIDRRREDAVKVLIEDLQAICDEVQMKCGIADGFNPYRFAQWHPSPEQIKKMQNEIRNGVMDSKFPDSIKDQYADRQYDRTQPYYQDVRDILSEHSFMFMMQSMKAGARALRNSDYVDPNIKRRLLQEILRTWEQVSNVLLILLPLLAIRGRAAFDGALFIVEEGFFYNLNNLTLYERLKAILTEIPTNIVSWCKDDLFSQKMGPLLFDQLVNEVNELKRHKLILLLIIQRPRGWKSHVQQYIISISKNSFYLYDVYLNLQEQYRYSYASPQTLRDIEYLIKMAAAKHHYGSKNPGIKKINKISDNVIPPREVDQDRN